MPQTLKYRIINAQAVRVQQAIMVDDDTPATATFERAIIEAEPELAGGKTGTFVIDAAALDEFPEGAILTVTIEAAPAVQQEG